MVYCPVRAAAARKLSSVTSKWMMAGLEPPGVPNGVELEITHSSVSGETYGRAWYTDPIGSANVGAKKGLWDSSADRPERMARTPRTVRATSAPDRSMKHASPMLPGNSVSR